MTSATEPLFSFAVVADVQFADKPSEFIEEIGRWRRYPEAKQKLEACVAAWNKIKLAFTVSLGDIIDGNTTLEQTQSDLESVVSVLRTNQHPHYDVLGNHCLRLDKAYVIDRLKSGGQQGDCLPAGIDGAHCYSFVVRGFRFVVLDGTDISLYGCLPGSPSFELAKEWLRTHPVTDHPHAQTWNSAIGSQQTAWLQKELQTACTMGQRVVVFCHYPIVAEMADNVHLLWNHSEIYSILTSPNSPVVAYLAGHYHRGGFAEQHKVAFWTVDGAVESPEGSACYAILHMYPDRIEIQGHGMVNSRTVSFLK
eukprot:TRINITY_DN14803_c0_g1_i1.p1 TRINITY_DN14803_c0_g1~~TRINITY_DN14803_c0_g1_i1.p1  ORF type:complete len:309 (+),score=-28.05 TRINITY_DN14803_c0_g1_i1:390-1316(+)